MSTSKIVLGLLCCVFLSSCSTAKQNEWFVNHNGNMPSEDRIAKITNGSTKDEVIQILGAPSAIVSFDDNSWIYMSSDIKRVAFKKPEEINRDILKLRFDNSNKVVEVTRLSKADGKEIVPCQEKTEVKGENLGFFRKYFGGVGQYNPLAGQNNSGRM
ncbi:MAG: outer membrane protein assembly factor BamE [Alphaproteobacteria bacterium]|nr:outer membrane protein assembly factor BamE [Alphaproteobacteria bacterium]